MEGRNSRDGNRLPLLSDDGDACRFGTWVGLLTLLGIMACSATIRSLCLTSSSQFFWSSTVVSTELRYSVTGGFGESSGDAALDLPASGVGSLAPLPIANLSLHHLLNLLKNQVKILCVHIVKRLWLWADTTRGRMFRSLSSIAKSIICYYGCNSKCSLPWVIAIATSLHIIPACIDGA
jgi:hypothetical protein